MLCAARYSSLAPFPSFVDFLYQAIHYLNGVNTKSSCRGQGGHSPSQANRISTWLQGLSVFAERPCSTEAQPV